MKFILSFLPLLALEPFALGAEPPFTCAVKLSWKEETSECSGKNYAPACFILYHDEKPHQQGCSYKAGTQIAKYMTELGNEFELKRKKHILKRECMMTPPGMRRCFPSYTKRVEGNPKVRVTFCCFGTSTVGKSTPVLFQETIWDKMSYPRMHAQAPEPGFPRIVDPPTTVISVSAESTASSAHFSTLIVASSCFIGMIFYLKDGSI